MHWGHHTSTARSRLFRQRDGNWNDAAHVGGLLQPWKLQTRGLDAVVSKCVVTSFCRCYSRSGTTRSGLDVARTRQRCLTSDCARTRDDAAALMVRTSCGSVCTRSDETAASAGKATVRGRGPRPTAGRAPCLRRILPCLPEIDGQANSRALSQSPTCSSTVTSGRCLLVGRSSSYALTTA